MSEGGAPCAGGRGNSIQVSNASVNTQVSTKTARTDRLEGGPDASPALIFTEMKRMCQALGTEQWEDPNLQERIQVRKTVTLGGGDNSRKMGREGSRERRRRQRWPVWQGLVRQTSLGLWGSSEGKIF